MTAENTEPPIRFAASTSPPPRSSVTTLDRSTLQRWRLELEDFVTETRNRLAAISRRVPAHGLISEDVSRHTSDHEVVDQQPVPKAGPPESTPTETINEQPATDPLASLSAIKQRLARQIENA